MIMTKNSVLLVLLVTSCCWWPPVGSSDEVLRKTNNSNSDDADGMSQQTPTAKVMLAEVNNTISSAAESQGASNASEANRMQSMASPATKEETSKLIDAADVESKKDKPDEASTSARPIRNGATPVRTSASRDNKLMSLLAARRSALQRNQWRSHRRPPPTNRTALESAAAISSISSTKNTDDPRTSCERNCTKNFTRRTTASCIRRCLALHKTTTTTATNSTAPRTKVDEKDNNEILETDESSHGFFVIAKDLNGTANHIGDGMKSSEVSTEKVIRSGALRPLENVEIPPYLYFGQKLPPLRPHRRANQTTETSTKQSGDRSKSWNRGHPVRNFGSYNRFHSSRNVIRPTTTPVALKPTPDISKEPLSQGTSQDMGTPELKEYILQPGFIAIAENSTEVIRIQSSTERPEQTSTEGKTEVVTNVTTATASTEPTDTTLPTISRATKMVTSRDAKGRTTSETTLAVPTKRTTPPVRTSTSESPVTYQTSVAEMQLTQASVLEPATSIILNTPHVTTLVETKPTEETLPPPPPVELTNMFEQVVDLDKPNLIIFYNITTQLPTPSSAGVFTRTTISSSVRSTVNPRVRPSLETPANVEFNLSSRPAETTTASVDSSRGSSLVFTEVTPSVNDLTGVTVVNGDVTIEIKNVNAATYILAGLGMLPIVIIILYVAKTIIMRRRYKDDDDLDQFTSDGKPISPVRQMDHSDQDSNDQYSSIVTERDFDRQNLRFKSLLGEGNFGQVWKAEADDLVGHMGTTRIVAIKTVRSGSTQVGLKDECDMMRKLGSHPNVVTLLGACLDTEPHLLIMEYAMRGRLLSLLRAARSATNILPASVPGGRSLAPLSPRTLAGFALDIARGMEYIAENKIVHRDLAARNVLLDHNGVCKICDFGMSIDLERSRHSPVPSKKSDSLQQTQCFDTRFHFDFGGRWMSHWNNNNSGSNDKKHNHDSVSKRPALPIRWMAPEALQYHIFSIKTDVWAFGIVLWEIATLGCTPYPNLSGREVIRNVPNGARPELPQDGRPEFYDLMQRCWRKDPQLRPSFREARSEISRISCKWHDDDLAASDYMDVSGFSEDLEHGMVYFNRRISEFECEI